MKFISHRISSGDGELMNDISGCRTYGEDTMKIYA